MNARVPSLDAAEHYDAMFARSEAIARSRAEAWNRTEQARRAITALGANVTERELSHLIAMVQALVCKSGWSHTETADMVNDGLTEAHSMLETAAEASEE